MILHEFEWDSTRFLWLLSLVTSFGPASQVKSEINQLNTTYCLAEKMFPYPGEARYIIGGQQ